MPEPYTHVIDTRGLSKAFDGIQALQDLDLRVPKNSIFGFLGPNGAGKTTTIKLLLGLIQPTAGGGRVFGLDIVKDSVEIRSRAGLPAAGAALLRAYDCPPDAGFHGGLFLQRARRSQSPSASRRCWSWLSCRTRPTARSKAFLAASGSGLGIAQAQVNYPDLLILDEPAASLDPMGTA